MSESKDSREERIETQEQGALEPLDLAPLTRRILWKLDLRYESLGDVHSSAHI